MLRSVLAGLFGCGLVVAADAADVITSGPRQVALLELFTSEGCSSCPPAEKWLGELRDDPDLWRAFVPVAFHVTYWDELGWPDRFARREFTERQYAYSRAWGARSVYTPGFVCNGREWRRGQSFGGGAITGKLTVRRISETSWRVEFFPDNVPARGGGFAVEMAILGGGISSSVRRGENAGKTLRHEFVALDLQRADLASDGDGRFATVLELERPTVARASRFAIAAWVTARGETEPLQAVGGWLE